MKKIFSNIYTWVIVCVFIIGIPLLGWAIITYGYEYFGNYFTIIANPISIVLIVYFIIRIRKTTIFVSAVGKKILKQLSLFDQEIKEKIPQIALVGYSAWEENVYKQIRKEIIKSKGKNFNNSNGYEEPSVAILCIKKINTLLMTGMYHMGRGALSSEGMYLKEVAAYMFNEKVSGHLKALGFSKEEIIDKKSQLFDERDHWIKTVG